MVGFPMPYPIFDNRIYPQTGSTELLHKCPIISLCLQPAKVFKEQIQIKSTSFDL
jgi:hypothetical protein